MAVNYPLFFDVAEDKLVPGQWRAEAVDQASGECHLALFIGPDAEIQAKEYAERRNRRSGHEAGLEGQR